MPSVIARHDALLQQIIEEHHGVVFRTLGDAVCSAFSQPTDALLGAVSAQRELLSGAWDGVGPLHVRMAIHTGPAEVRDTGYVGHTLNRVARILSAGHGGQILLSRTVRDLVVDALPSDISLCDLGRHRLKDLAQDEHIFGVAAPGLPIDFPPLVTLNRIVANLPVQPTRFIGRDRERADLCRLLGEGDVRLVTLTGPGGTGKTRLALQAAGDLVDRFPEGAFFVPLSAVIDPAFVARQIASAVGVRETGSRPLTALLRLFFGDRKLLLLLDNFEQVISAASLVGELLAGCPSLRVLVTSREALHLAGEQEYPVPTLTLPEANGHANGHSVDIDSLLASESVALFLDRARTVKPDFTVTPDSAGAVVDIVRRVDGLPLAIELAAARIRVFPPHALARRLDRRLQILTGGPRDQPERQQTLRGAIDWSFRLLDDPEQVLFRRLSVFAGGCFLDAAEAICALEEDQRFDITSGLVSLVEKSLLRQEESLEGEPRFAMLETIRE
jgi:predicted ATPase